MSTTTTKYLGAYVGQDTMDKLDKFRGQVPRSRVIENALIHYLTAHGAQNREMLRNGNGVRASTSNVSHLPPTPTPFPPYATGGSATYDGVYQVQ